MPGRYVVFRLDIAWLLCQLETCEIALLKQLLWWAWSVGGAVVHDYRDVTLAAMVGGEKVPKVNVRLKSLRRRCFRSWFYQLLVSRHAILCYFHFGWNYHLCPKMAPCGNCICQKWCTGSLTKGVSFRTFTSCPSPWICFVNIKKIVFGR